MGIKNFTEVVKPAIMRAEIEITSLADYFEENKQSSRNFTDRPVNIGVDFSTYLHRCRKDLYESNPPGYLKNAVDTVISHIRSTIPRDLEYKLFIALDGPPPAEKKRVSIDDTPINSLRHPSLSADRVARYGMSEYKHYVWCRCPSEAEIQLAYALNGGILDFVFLCDSDIYMYVSPAKVKAVVQDGFSANSRKLTYYNFDPLLSLRGHLLASKDEKLVRSWLKSRCTALDNSVHSLLSEFKELGETYLTGNIFDNTRITSVDDIFNFRASILKLIDDYIEKCAAYQIVKDAHLRYGSPCEYSSAYIADTEKNEGVPERNLEDAILLGTVLGTDYTDHIATPSIAAPTFRSLRRMATERTPAALYPLKINERAITTQKVITPSGYILPVFKHNKKIAAFKSFLSNETEKKN